MKVVLLLGPSSAGKSTICDELHKIYQWRVSSGDTVNNSIYGGHARAGLSEKNLFDQLKEYMREKQIITLCMRGLLNISKGDHLVENYQFSHPTYPELSTCLTEAGFSKSEKEKLLPLLQAVGQVHIDFVNKNIRIDEEGELLNDAFNSKNPDETVVIDHIPIPNGGAEKFLERFNEHVKKYQEAHGEDAIQSFVILAYCSPQQLSERVQKRNREAEESGDLNNRRRGPFPFDQLSALIQVGLFQESKQNRVGTISHDQLAEIVTKHPWPEREKSKDFSSEAVAKSITDSVLTSVFEYANLSEKYGIVSKKEMQDLVVRPEFESYPRINTTEGSPKELAEQMVQVTQTESLNRFRL